MVSEGVEISLPVLELKVYGHCPWGGYCGLRMWMDMLPGGLALNPPIDAHSLILHVSVRSMGWCPKASPPIPRTSLLLNLSFPASGECCPDAALMLPSMQLVKLYPLQGVHSRALSPVPPEGRRTRTSNAFPPVVPPLPLPPCLRWMLRSLPLAVLRSPRAWGWRT